VLLVGTSVLLLSGCTHTAGASDDGRAVRAARHFLTAYVDGDGRVDRHDQGGDTVSEGVGYALLIAVAIGDRPTFDRVWSWATTHLLQPDGLLASHWAAGAVVDPHSAADADEQVAWALARAGRAWGARYTDAATALARAVADHEIGYDDQGQPVLAAGTWATGSSGRRTVAEPGYWAAPAVTALAALTGDNRWKALDASQHTMLTALTGGGARLPADWVTTGGGHPIAAIASPVDQAAPRCGQDGLRTVVWSALDAPNAALAVAWGRMLARTVTATPLAVDLEGHIVDAARGPLFAVAAAAGAHARGDVAAERHDLAIADTTVRTYPTYYGAAWDALGRLLLTTTRLEEAR
jgi:endoglucanase